MSHRLRRAYDHGIEEQIIHAGDPELFPELEIPLSWLLVRSARHERVNRML